MENHAKALKERSMNQQFRSRFEAGLQKIADSLTKKGGVKQEDKVPQRFGRLKQKYPSIGRYFDIETEVKEDVRVKRKRKGTETDLDLRPIYHQNDQRTMAHLHLGLLAYWVVNTVRHQLKVKGIHSGWREIVRIMNTQKAVTTLA